jgi:DNA-binding CsgD family transcriptional regulator
MSVVALLPTHRTLAAIGDELGVARPTVKTHVQHIYEKLGANNRAEAVGLAERAGILTSPAIPAGRVTRRAGDALAGKCG